MKTVCLGATLQCSCGVLPSIMIVPPRPLTIEMLKFVATIFDYQPLINIPPFGGCTAPTNPNAVVGPAKACVPVFALPWLSMVPSISLLGIPLLDDSATLLCAYGGMVKVIDPGQLLTTHTPDTLVGGGSGGGASS